jgi:hypothetical protein
MLTVMLVISLFVFFGGLVSIVKDDVAGHPVRSEAAADDRRRWLAVKHFHVSFFRSFVKAVSGDSHEKPFEIKERNYPNLSDEQIKVHPKY